MALNWDKYDIENRNDYAINRNRTLFDFMKRTFNLMDGLYLHENYILVDTIKEDQSRQQIAAETEKLIEKKGKKKRK